MPGIDPSMDNDYGRIMVSLNKFSGACLLWDLATMIGFEFGDAEEWPTNMEEARTLAESCEKQLLDSGWSLEITSGTYVDFQFQFPPGQVKYDKDPHFFSISQRDECWLFSLCIRDNEYFTLHSEVADVVGRIVARSMWGR